MGELEHLEPQCDRLYAAGRYGEARALAQRILDAREAGAAASPAAYATALMRAGRLNGKLADYTRAEQQLRRSLEILGPGADRKIPEKLPVLRALANVLADTGRSAEAETFYCQAIGIARDIHGERSAEFARCLHALCPLYALERRDFVEAERMLRQAMEIWKDCTADADYAECLDDYGMLLLSHDKHAAARSYLVQAMELRAAMVGTEHVDYTHSQTSMASLLIDEGDTAGAAPLVEAAMRIRTGVFGEMHPLYAECLALQAAILLASGDCLRSRPLLARAEDIVRRTAGPASRAHRFVLDLMQAQCIAAGDLQPCLAISGRVLESMAGLFFDGTLAQAEATDRHATTLIQLERLDEAAKLLDRSGNMVRQHPHCTNHALIGHLEAHARLSLQCQRLDELRAMREEILALREKEDGPQATSTGLERAKLAIVLALQGESEAAAEHARRAREIVAAAVGDEHLLYSDCLCIVADYTSAAGMPDQAEELVNMAARIRRNVLGEHHPLYADCLESQAQIERRRDEYTHALELQQQAADIREKTCGADSGRFAAALVPLAEVHMRLDHHARVEELLMKTLGTLQLQVGEQHSQYMLALMCLAGMQLACDDTSRAEATFEKLLTIHRRGGKKNPANYADCLNYLAHVRMELQRFEQADELYREAIDICMAAENGIAPTTMASYMLKYGDMQLLSGNISRAEALYRQARRVFREECGKGHPDYRAACERLVALCEFRPGLLGWRRLLARLGL